MKNIDTEFVGEFIQDCSKNGQTLPEQICEEANKQIMLLDIEIGERVQRQMKIAGVLETFGFKPKSEKPAAADPSKLDKIFATEIAKMMEGRKIQLSDMSKFLGKFSENHRKNLIFNLKCMIEGKILNRDSSGFLSEGEKYHEYFKS
jgi:hypothetical protein